MDLFFQFFDQMCFEILDMVFNRWLAFGLARRRRKYDRIVEIFQIGIRCLKYQFIFCMLFYCRF